MAEVKDYIGKTFGKLVILEELPKVYRRKTCLVKCSCGREKKADFLHVLHGRIRSCDCSRTDTFLKKFKEKIKSYIGKRYGRLVIFSIAKERYKTGGGRTPIVNCKCDCGIVKECMLTHLIYGNIVSCGCFHQEITSALFKTHGFTTTHNKEYTTWRDMMDRCYNSKNPYYHYYGGRGIGVSKEWIKIENFIQDMAPRPNGFSLERIDNNSGYSKENCKWASQKEQCRNTRRNRYFTINNETLCLSEWAERYGIPYSTVKYRIYSGYTIQKALGIEPN